MILEHASPVCEFDTDRDALIRPGIFSAKHFRPKGRDDARERQFVPLNFAKLRGHNCPQEEVRF